MRDSAAKAITNWALVSEMKNRSVVRPEHFPFSYKWFHESTGNSGIRTIQMPDRASLEEWIARWNHSNFANGWFYSLPQ